MKNKILLLSVALGIVLLLTGCTQKQNDTNNEDQSNQEKTYTETYQITDGEAFSDGMAWVTLSDDTGSQTLSAIDNQGKLKFKMDGVATDIYHTRFVNGTACVKLDEEKYELIDTEGNALTTIDSRVLETSGDYYFVTQELTGIEEAQTKIGILDSQGNWALPMQDMLEKDEENPQYMFWECFVNKWYGQTDYGFLGDGLFWGHNTRTHDVYLANIKENAYAKIADEESTIAYENNQIYVQNSHKDLLIYDTHGTLIKEIDSWSNDVDDTLKDSLEYYGKGYFADGVWYLDRTEQYNNLGGGNVNDTEGAAGNGLILTPEGQILCDLQKKYNTMTINYASKPEAGYIGIRISGSDKKNYYTVMTSNGEFCFEPKEKYAGGEMFFANDFSDGAFLIQTGENTYSFMDLEGNVLETITTEESLNFSLIGNSKYYFSEGLIYIDGRYYDGKGNIVIENEIK